MSSLFSLSRTGNKLFLVILLTFLSACAPPPSIIDAVTLARTGKSTVPLLVVGTLLVVTGLAIAWGVGRAASTWNDDEDDEL